MEVKLTTCPCHAPPWVMGQVVERIGQLRLIHRAIRDQKSLPVDVVVGKSGKFAKRKATPTIERTISQEGIVLYG
ncbi:hypothetical protein [Desulfosporosinus sp. OT]|uniref:hypothetical protein n=1 Tax=Desulfosporosinus sp. OT TaxID=913865 RepID=UPI00178C2E06|nr:hypothetical protein [Desulfosporosinus sp. OT]